MQARLTSRLAVGIVALCLGFAGCQSAEFNGNALFIREVTTGPNDLTLTMRVGTSMTVSGMQVDTIGNDTIVTRLRDGGARRFILNGMVGYRGRIRLDSVDLIVGDVSIWIDEKNVKVSGPDGSIDKRLLNDGVDVFDGRDVIITRTEIRPAGETH